MTSERNADGQIHHVVTRLGFLLLFLEGLLLVAGGLFLAYTGVSELLKPVEIASERSNSPIAVQFFLSLMFAALGAGLLIALRARLRGDVGLRGLVITWQLIQAGAAIQTLRHQEAIPMSGSMRLSWGLPLLVSALIVGWSWLALSAKER